MNLSVNPVMTNQNKNIGKRQQLGFKAELEITPEAREGIKQNSRNTQINFETLPAIFKALTTSEKLTGREGGIKGTAKIEMKPVKRFGSEEPTPCLSYKTESGKVYDSRGLSEPTPYTIDMKSSIGMTSTLNAVKSIIYNIGELIRGTHSREELSATGEQKHQLSRENDFAKLNDRLN